MKAILILSVVFIIARSGSQLQTGESSCGVVCSLFRTISKVFASDCANRSYIQLPNSAYFFNNQWGRDAAKPGYYECIEGTTVTYSWQALDPSKYLVKAYPAIVTGWHFGYLNGEGSGGLPVLVESSPTLKISWSVKHTNLGNIESYDTSFDMWLGGVGEKDPSGPTSEVMVWMNCVDQHPLGTYAETVNFWGLEFDLYAHFGGNPAWNVFSFVPKENTWSFNNQDLFDFFYHLWKVKKWIDGGQYICGIEAGNELLQGQGTFTHTYSLKVN
jgi:hypothetical protein